MQGTGAGFATVQAGSASTFSTTLCTDIDNDGAINVVTVEGGLSNFNQPPYVWNIDVTVYRWGSDGTVQRLPQADRSGTLPDEDRGPVPDTGPPCQGLDAPGVLAFVDF